MCSLVVQLSRTLWTKDQSLTPETSFVLICLLNDDFYLFWVARADDIHQGGGHVLIAGAARHQAQGRRVGLG